MGNERKVFVKVIPLPDYCIDIETQTGSRIHFDFNTRLQSVRFGLLRDEEIFNSVHTDGFYLLFGEAGREAVKIAAPDFMDMIMVDRTRG
jgi:two-component system chemotaxis response regulator CheY